MKKLDVCLINDSFPPLIDGVANAVVNYATIIQQQLGNAFVATPEYPNVKDEYPFDVLRYPSIDTTKIVGYRLGLPFNVSYLSAFNERNIDIIHTHCPVTSTYLARVLSTQLNKPVVLTYHTKFDIDIKKAVDSKLIQDVAINALVANIEKVDEVWAVSKGAGENLKSLGYKGECIVMPNGVDFVKSRAPQSAIDEIKAAYKLPSDKPIFLFVGRMMWYKGIRIILDALKQVKQHNIDFRMMFVGGGTDFEEIKAYTKECDLLDKCIFTGPIYDRDMLKAVYCASDLFLFPSTFDTNGIVVREAAASGLGSVLIKNSCAAEDTVDQQNVLLIDENADSLAKLLIENGENVDYFHRIGHNAQEQLYVSWEEAVTKAYERYQVVIDKHNYDEHREFDITDTFFDLWGDLANAFSTTKQFTQKTIDTATQTTTKIITDLDDLKADTEYLVRNIRKDIEDTSDKVWDYIDSMLDRYL